MGGARGGRRVTRPASVYLHLPFCASTCAYCTFTTSTDRTLLPRYMAALRREVEAVGRLAGRPLRSLYLGGGTPSLVPEKDLAALFAVVDRFFPRLPTAEVTLEANPDDVTPAKLRVWRQLGVNRLSLGIQAFSDRVLRLLSRRHNAEKARQALAEALDAGFLVSCDLMLALPGLRRPELEGTLSELVRFRPHHVSVYLLEMDKPHRLAQLATRNPCLFPSEEAAARQYLFASRFLRRSGFLHYEVSNFASPPHYARHNLRYWLGGVVLACGVAAAGQGRRSRWVNTPSLAAYLEAVEKGLSPRQEHRRLAPRVAEAERLMLRLRLRWGAEEGLVARVASHFPAFAQRLEDFLLAGLARRHRGRVRLSPRGWLVSNELFATLV